MNVLKMLPVAVLLATGLSNVQAAADFLTLQRGQTNLSDSAAQLLVNFTLPANVNRSSSTANSAVLDIEAGGVEFDAIEVYVNPPTLVCGDNVPDGNQPASIGLLREHDDDNLKTEWATNHFAFSSALLLAGTNRLMICTRNNIGEIGPGAGNLDNVSVKSIVLHYHTN